MKKLSLKERAKQRGLIPNLDKAKNPFSRFMRERSLLECWKLRNNDYKIIYQESGMFKGLQIEK